MVGDRVRSFFYDDVEVLSSCWTKLMAGRVLRESHRRHLWTRTQFSLAASSSSLFFFSSRGCLDVDKNPAAVVDSE